MTRNRLVLGAAIVILAVLVVVTEGAAHSPADLLAELRAVGVRTEQRDDLDRIAEQRAAQLVDCHAEGAFSRCHDIAWVQVRTPGTWTVGEVLAWEPDAYPNPAKAAVIKWMASAGHRDILRGDWNAVGVGAADAGERHYFVAVFAKVPRMKAPTRAPTPRTVETRQPAVAPRVMTTPTLPPTDTAP